MEKAIKCYTHFFKLVPNEMYPHLQKCINLILFYTARVDIKH